MSFETFHFLRPAWLLATLGLIPLFWAAHRNARAAGAWQQVCDAPLLRPEDVTKLLEWHREDIKRTFELPQHAEAAEKHLYLGLRNIYQTMIAYSDGIG